MAVGAIAFAFLLMTEPRRAWGSYAINTMYWLGMAMGGVVRIGRDPPVQRPLAGRPADRESLSAFLPYGIGSDGGAARGGIWPTWPWTRGVGAFPAPEAFLNVPFLWVRTLGGLTLFWCWRRSW